MAESRKGYLDARDSRLSDARSRPRGPESRPVILDVKGDHGESEMKGNEVLVKVFETGRLQMAWQQVRKNAGAAGIDRMTVEEFA